MPYIVSVERSFTARREPDQSGRTDMVLTVGVEFAEDQLTDRGWLFDNESMDVVLTERAEFLATAAWTDLFSFRPTFELVTRELFHQLAGSITQLRFVELADRTVGVTTRFSP
jgi:hypothetical protein